MDTTRQEAERQARRAFYLSAETERALVEAYQQHGDRAARERLVMAHEDLVEGIVRRYRGYQVDEDDLRQEGFIGVSDAVERFDVARGLRFSTFARHYAHTRIRQYVGENVGIVRTFTSPKALKAYFRVAAAGLEEDQERPERERNAALAERIGVSVSLVERARRRRRLTDEPLDAPDGLGRILGDQLLSSELGAGDPSVLLEAEEADSEVSSFASALAAELDERERAVLIERMLAEEPASLASLGRRFAVSRERMRQIERDLRERVGSMLDEMRLGEALLEEER